MLHKHKDGCKPCPHMRTLVSAWLDGQLSGIAKWYTEWHMSNCPTCSSSVPFFKSLHERLVSLGSLDHGGGLSDERWERLAREWDAVEEKSTRH